VIIQMITKMAQAKSKLSELCMKNNMTVKYDIVDTRGSPHEKEWLCRVYVSLLDEIEPISRVGEWNRRKRDAEASAAQNILEGLEILLKKPEKSVYIVPQIVSTIVMFDIENIPDLVNLKFKKDVHKIGFISRFSHHRDNLNKLEEICDMRVIDSSDSNASDIYMIFETGRIVATLRNTPRFVIVSRDKFSSTLVTCLTSFGYQSFVATTEEDLLNLEVI